MDIIVVEDNIVQQDLMKLYIEDCGHELKGVFSSAEDAEIALLKHLPDLIFMDINLDGLQSGIDLAKAIKQKWQTPVIFTTSQTDTAILSQAVKNEPVDVLIKPIQFEQLKASLLLAEAKLETTNSQQSTKFTIKGDYLIYKNGHLFERSLLSELQYIEGMGNYFNLNFKNNKVTLKGTLSEIQETLSKNDFVRINRSVIVSVKDIKSFNNKRVFLNTGQEFPLSKKISDELMTRLMG